MLDAHATVLLAVDLDELLVGIEQQVVGLVSDRVDGEVQPRSGQVGRDQLEQEQCPAVAHMREHLLVSAQRPGAQLLLSSQHQARI